MSYRDCPDISEERLQATNSLVFGATNLTAALWRASPVGNPKASNVHRTYVIGGASLFNECIKLAYGYERIDRLLLTRILSPAFEECDTFISEFREQLAEDYRLLWKRASHEKLEEWVGFEVPKGEQEENGVKYEFQLWYC